MQIIVSWSECSIDIHTSPRLGSISALTHLMGESPKNIVRLLWDVEDRFMVHLLATRLANGASWYRPQPTETSED
jgi:hypothetical protein